MASRIMYALIVAFAVAVIALLNAGYHNAATICSAIVFVIALANCVIRPTIRAGRTN